MSLGGWADLQRDLLGERGEFDWRAQARAFIASHLQITERKEEIIWDLLKGMTNKEIAHHLGVTEQAIKNQLGEIGDILGVNGRLQIALTVLGVIGD
jgi:DNA-binding NarL/FixJ family response regulator